MTINKKTYLMAAALTFAIILGVFGLNWIINAQREDVIQKNLLNMQSSMMESQLEMDYLIGFAGGCSMLEEGKKNIANIYI